MLATAGPGSAEADAKDRLPDFIDLEEQPQLAAVAALQVVANVTAESLAAHHGAAQRLVDHLSDDPDAVIAVLAHVIVQRCHALSELTAAYRFALRRRQP